MKKFFCNLKAILTSDIHELFRSLENILGHGIGVLKELFIILIILSISPLGWTAMTVAVGLMWGWTWAIIPVGIGFLVIAILQVSFK